MLIGIQYHDANTPKVLSMLLYLQNHPKYLEVSEVIRSIYRCFVLKY
jgi:hypothetical protein